MRKSFGINETIGTVLLPSPPPPSTGHEKGKFIPTWLSTIAQAADCLQKKTE
jgi:hypothetical protein